MGSTKHPVKSVLEKLVEGRWFQPFLTLINGDIIRPYKLKKEKKERKKYDDQEGDGWIYGGAY